MRDTNKAREELKREVARLSERVSVLDAESQTFKIALQSFGDALISTDTDGNILQMNTSAEEMTGWRQAKAIGQPLANVFRIVSEVTGDEIENLVERLLYERIVVDWTNHTLLIAKDGSKRPIANCGAPIRNAKGEITGVVLVFRDQTAELATKQALGQSEARFRDTFERSTVGISLTAIDGRLIKVNHAFASMLGLSIEEMQQVDFSQLTHPDDIARSLECSRCLLTDERSTCQLEKRYKHRDGHFMIADVSMTLTRDQLGQPLHFITTIVDITERNRIECALRVSEARYRRLFEAAKDGILILDANTGEIVDVNPFLLELTGHWREDFMGQHLWEIGLFKDVASSKTEFATLQAKGYVRYEHLPLQARDGRRIDVEFVSNVCLVDGQAVIQCNIRDITAHKRSQKRDKVTRELLELLNDQEAESNQIRNILQLIQRSTGMQSVGIRLKEGDDFPYCETDGFPDHFVQTERYLCTHDAAGEIVRDAQGIPYLECMCGNVLCGRTNPKLPFFTEGGSFWSNCTTDLLASTTDEDRQAHTPNRCNGEGYESVALVPLRCNSEIIGLLQLNDRRRNRIDLDMIQFLEAASSTIGIALARKRADEALRQSEERFRILFERAADSIILLEISSEGIPVIRDANSATFRLLGYERSELIGQPVSVIDGSPDASKVIGQSRDSILYGTGMTFEVSHRCKDGAIRHFECAVAEMQIGSDTLAISVERDITERKRGQAEREELEKQLGASQKMEAIGSLAGGVAHDFNNLLSVILIYNEFAVEGAADNVALKDDLLEVKIAADRAVALTQQLLAFSRKQVLQPVPLLLNEIVVGLQNMLQRVLGEDIDLVQVLAPNLGLTLADPSQIEQVLMNLVVNARDAMPEGGKLTIETSNVELDEQYAVCHMAVKPGSYVELVVTDTGHGMDEQTRARIFEPFFTTKDKSQGTGLGLSTVYGIIKQSGGNIWVYSELGTGTSFKIYLPREVSSTMATAIKPSLSPTRATDAATILLVEDHEALRKAAKRTLDAAGYTVLTAVDGNDALLICSQRASDIQLLLSDVVMPGMSGAALAKEMLKARPTLKVLYMSGYTDNTIDQHGVLPAGTHFIGKPFTGGDLTRKVREVLDHE